MTCNEGIVQEFRVFMVTYTGTVLQPWECFFFTVEEPGLWLNSFQVLDLLPMEIPEERVYDNLFNSDRRTPHYSVG